MHRSAVVTISITTATGQPTKIATEETATPVRTRTAMDMAAIARKARIAMTATPIFIPGQRRRVETASTKIATVRTKSAPTSVRTTMVMGTVSRERTPAVKTAVLTATTATRM
jgi:hypothetical protein